MELKDAMVQLESLYTYLTPYEGPPRMPDWAGVQSYLPRLLVDETDAVQGEILAGEERHIMVERIFSRWDMLRRGFRDEEEARVWCLTPQAAAEIAAAIQTLEAWHLIHDAQPVPPPPPPDPTPDFPDGHFVETGRFDRDGSVFGGFNDGIATWKNVINKSQNTTDPRVGGACKILSVDPLRFDWGHVTSGIAPESVADHARLKSGRYAAGSENLGNLLESADGLAWTLLASPKDFGIDIGTRAFAVACCVDDRDVAWWAIVEGPTSHLIVQEPGHKPRKLAEVPGTIFQFLPSPGRMLWASGHDEKGRPCGWWITAEGNADKLLSPRASEDYIWRGVRLDDGQVITGDRPSGHVFLADFGGITEVYAGPGKGECFPDRMVIWKSWLLACYSDGVLRRWPLPLIGTLKGLVEEHVSDTRTTLRGLEIVNDRPCLIANRDGETDAAMYVRK